MASDSKENNNHLVKTPSEEEEEDYDGACALLLGCNPIFSAVLKAALELHLFEIIANEASSYGAPMSVSEIASHLPTQHPEMPRRLERMLHLLASHSLLACSSRTNQDGGLERVYGLTPVAQYFAHDISAELFRSLSKFLSHQAITEVLINFKDAILDSEADLFKKIHGKTAYEYMATDPTLNEAFQAVMTKFCLIDTLGVLEVYNGFEGISTLVDVGGGSGQNLQMIIAEYPSIKGINFDLPQVIKNAPKLSGIEHVGGDMFTSVPSGDAMMLKAITHNWSDETCVTILRNCNKALTEKGKVIIVDVIMPETIEPTVKAQLTCRLDNMMFLYAGGRERTEKEFEALCKQSGFSGFQVVCRAHSALGVIEFHKG
ncbi:hypothetical protein L6164_000997 [Bauhinia variegata]|uniref:Uncharacterized protein n=1 Tax=Bauhinia variegata TaxID=167791 RepID=A0ACB9QAA9_BAUVA|nr:hypothetical protein L6164_000997 [Bauhinia variegata]